MTDWEEKIAIVIVNYKNYELTIENVRSLQSLSGRVKIVIVDNCSPNNSYETLLSAFGNEKNIHIIYNDKNEGYARGNNVGIEYINAHLKGVEMVLISNPDIIVKNLYTIEKMYTALKQDKALGAVTVQTVLNGTLHEPNESSWKFYTLRELIFEGNILFGRFVKRKKYSKYVIDENGISYVDIVQGCFFMCRLTDLIEVGGFDPNTFLYGEEQILARRFLKNGLRCGILPLLYIEHNHQTKDGALKTKASKLFDLKCYYGAREYYVKEYTDYCWLIKRLILLSNKLDYHIKKAVFRIMLH